jgi:hypothetical protein
MLIKKIQWYENEKKCETIHNHGKTLVCLNLKFQMILKGKTLRDLGLAHCSLAFQ